jgi:phosphoglycerate dehydrogenase-like enzyme
MRFHKYQEEFLSLIDSDIEISEGKEISHPADYEVLIHPTPSKDWIEASPNLQSVIIPWAGIPEETRTVLKAYPGISLHNSHHNRYNTAELAFGLLLAAAKCIIPMDQALRKNDWSPRYQKPKTILLRGKTAVILGFGEIGQAIGDYCLGFGMQVIGVKKSLDAQQSFEDLELQTIDNLYEVLPKADVLIVALPLTEETDGLIGKKEFELMPKGSILINIGRGPIVNQVALYDALKERHLKAAGSDVWYNYPETQEARQNTPPADVPFGGLDNFVLSPHRGGMVENVDQQRAESIAEMLNAANRGYEMPNKVDLQAGY